jgi:hypothetical protein
VTHHSLRLPRGGAVYDYYTYHEARDRQETRRREAEAERTARQYTRARRRKRRHRERMAAAWQTMTARQRTA